MEIRIGKIFHIDTGEVSQYENERIIDDVKVIEIPKKYSKRILVYSPKLRANILVKIKDLR